MFLLKDLQNLYVGSHWKTVCQLQESDRAYYFEKKSDAETCQRNLKDYCGMFLKIEDR